MVGVGKINHSYHFQQRCFCFKPEETNWQPELWWCKMGLRVICKKNLPFVQATFDKKIHKIIISIEWEWKKINRFAIYIA